MKPLQGIIRYWRYEDNRIYGHIVWHQRHNPETTEFAPDHRIVTSRVIRLLDEVPGSDFGVCETENSFYILCNGEG